MKEEKKIKKLCSVTSLTAGSTGDNPETLMFMPHILDYEHTWNMNKNAVQVGKAQSDLRMSERFAFKRLLFQKKKKKSTLCQTQQKG